MDNHRIHYTLRFPDGGSLEFPLEFTRADFTLVVAQGRLPDWTLLGRHQCEHCPLDSATSPRCPLAVAILNVVEATDQLVSHDRAEVEVVFETRTLSATVPAADALRSLMGLIIPTSGCPHTAFFRPMARFHLPFSDQDETLYRVTSMYALTQRIRGARDLEMDPGYDGLAEIYANINLVNMYVVERLQEAADKDSTRNAVTLLDVFAQLLPMQLDDPLDEQLPYFDAFTKA
ncbi:MAG: hypothetical protein ABI333_01870 [bacterium]